MPQEGSVGPKERVKIVYRPATGDAQEEKQIPLRLLVLADFTGRSDPTKIEDRPVVNVDKVNFPEILKKQAIHLEFSVPDRISGRPDEELKVELDIRSMKDFGPESIAENVPQLKRLIDIRRALIALKDPLTNNPEFRKRLQAMLNDEGKRQSILDELALGGPQKS